MSVLKSKRAKSQFEVFHSYYALREQLTDFLLRDFGFSLEKAQKKISRQFGNRPRNELDESEQARFDDMFEKDRAIDEWYIEKERDAIIDYLRQLGMYLFSANSIYPQYQYELSQRRIYQERALACCEMLTQELQYIIETLPVDVNKYTGFATMIEQEIALIKGWRKSDNKFKKNLLNDEK